MIVEDGAICTGRNGVCGGTYLGGFICRLWTPALTGPGVDTGSTKRPHCTILEDRVSSQCCKVEDNDIPYGSDYIIDVGRGVQKVQYREGSNLP